MLRYNINVFTEMSYKRQELCEIVSSVCLPLDVRSSCLIRTV
jgi:hypothetical protein